MHDTIYSHVAATVNLIAQFSDFRFRSGRDKFGSVFEPHRIRQIRRANFNRPRSERALRGSQGEQFGRILASAHRLCGRREVFNAGR